MAKKAKYSTGKQNIRNILFTQLIFCFLGQYFVFLANILFSWIIFCLPRSRGGGRIGDLGQAQIHVFYEDLGPDRPLHPSPGADPGQNPRKNKKILAWPGSPFRHLHSKVVGAQRGSVINLAALPENGASSKKISLRRAPTLVSAEVYWE